MSLTVSSASAAPTQCATFNQIPTLDNACAIPNLSNGSDIMKKCCKDAPVEEYDNDCGFYCLTVGQVNSDLIRCLQENGAGFNDVICRGNGSASATATPSPSAKETDKETRTDGDNRPSRTNAAATQSSTGAAPAMIAPQSVSKAGLGMLAMLFISAAAGALL